FLSTSAFLRISSDNAGRRRGRDCSARVGLEKSMIIPIRQTTVDLDYFNIRY
ncbi:MAG: hypothetical protein ACI90V_009931, partial [Bacillariaceae sp.]